MKLNKSSQKYSLIERILFPKTSLNRTRLKEKLNGKTILITGASFGIGESLSLLLAETKAHQLQKITSDIESSTAP